ncbi:NAD(P)-binding protein [Aspergillus brunneoviolaceus CBS 621.78]|uniref:NAD(P)-binding protein n=1 Tax=Aspergillus brunneoviolaceus CBS 621.78 TaxID=1450534 RepID=A0ACD1GPL2_9EURO|nr:NAD(P)-binding protein [Aspergillus brunneoviolaceus CBS 621.78]RAH51177.1 NAD(P)-binding protein [Aspergillus brunneoviolaceus CBS 621.78]
MPAKVFLTGATGYIGGDALYQIHQEHPDFEYALLIRSEAKAKKVQSAYPKARIVIGGNDDLELLAREAAWADIVIHTADSSDHADAATAIAKGLIQGHSASRPGFWLHTGGAGILTYFDSEVKKTFGEHDDKVFNDWGGVDELVNLPAAAFHRNVDEIVLETGTKHAASVKTALLCPPTIYGPGRGPISGRGRQVYELASFILKEQYCPYIGKGLSRWNNVHVHDLSRVFGLLVQAALDPSCQHDEEVWGARGYYLTENGEHVWGELSAAVGEEAFKQKYIKGGRPELRAWSIDEAVKSSAGFEAASWGMNSRGSAVRAKKVLGWKPQGRSLSEEVPDIVRSEATRMGL